RQRGVAVERRIARACRPGPVAGVVEGVGRRAVARRLVRPRCGAGVDGTRRQYRHAGRTRRDAGRALAAAGCARARVRRGTASMSTIQQRDIRGVLIQTEAARLLLPNATISEVLSYADPEPVADAPAWLLGRIRWRGWRLPLVAFAPLAGLGEEHGGLGSKVIVLKALGARADM